MPSKRSRNVTPVALLLIDVINDFDFPESGQLLKHARSAARRIVDLSARARHAGVPVIYVNDNFGRWRSDFRSQLSYCSRSSSRGHQIAQWLSPQPDDYFVLKPKHSGFFSTTLDVLLRHLSIKKLILTGFAGDICVLYTANDAYMRDYEIVVAEDGVASETAAGNKYALAQMKRIHGAKVKPSAEISFA